MSVEFALPQMGFDMTEGRIAHWLKRVGDQVRPGEVLAEIATEKVTLELVDHPGGVIEKFLASEGDMVTVGTPIVLFAGTEAMSLVGDEAHAPARVKVSPLARRLAEDKGVDLTTVRGSGPGGRIVRDDVLQAMQQKRTRPGVGGATPAVDAARAGAPAGVPAAAAPLPALRSEMQDLSPMRQAIARRMQESKQQIPHFYLTTDVNMDLTLAMRSEIMKLAGADVKVTINDFIIKATALSLALHPSMNAWFVDGRIHTHERVNIGLAVALDEGLVVPALLDCQNRSLGQIATGARDLINRARGGAIKADEFTGGTFSISNLGMYGITSFQAIINPPQIGILSVGAVVKAPVVDGEQIRIGSVMKMGISVDHRATDGARAAQFLADVRRFLESPVLMAL
jgi:pyruvate dehydrogenase E2 component (dihydrolipoamide acetyltransferase)